ncbi:hypothetical protein Pelo_5367 [Pelomyxa schiedti]|nr:hypothetical protein Pelo_5367 [Pelomyxa schiedti]
MTTKGGATVKMVVTVYEGEWDRGKWHGVGTWVSPDGSGDIYHGQFDHGKKCGTGSILFGAGGGSYVGEWKDDVFHGWGVRLWANGDSEPEIQECARNISTLTKKVLGIKSSATSTHTVLKEEESDDDNTVDDILMKPLLQLQRDHTLTPPFQLLCTLSDTLAQLQRCQFSECTKLADKHTVLSKELSEQVSIGGTLHKAIEDTQRECSELQREHNGKWKVQRGLEGDERFIGMPCVWSQLSELLPQAQQAMFPQHK